MILYHIITRVIPIINKAKFEIENFTWIIPYCVLIIGSVFIYLKHRSNKSKYDQFINNSPGITIDTSDIVFGKGHPKYQKNKNEIKKDK